MVQQLSMNNQHNTSLPHVVTFYIHGMSSIVILRDNFSCNVLYIHRAIYDNCMSDVNLLFRHFHPIASYISSVASISLRQYYHRLFLFWTLLFSDTFLYARNCCHWKFKSFTNFDTNSSYLKLDHTKLNLFFRLFNADTRGV